MSDTFSVVYVEDDAFSREVMALLMRTAFPDIPLTIFSDSADFIDRLGLLPNVPRLFLLDVHIEPLDGFGMLQQLRADPRYAGSLVIAVTASVMNQEIVQLRQAGFNGAIGKPLDFDQFPSLISDVINGKEVWYVT